MKSYIGSIYMVDDDGNYICWEDREFMADGDHEDAKNFMRKWCASENASMLDWCKKHKEPIVQYNWCLW